MSFSTNLELHVLLSILTSISEGLDTLGKNCGEHCLPRKARLWSLGACQAEHPSEGRSLPDLNGWTVTATYL